ncbi:hypothetical protein ABFA25_12905 [Mycobacterium lepromatosis]|nr:hypothetical protein [Mycobacterium lepromatosis]
MTAASDRRPRDPTGRRQAIVETTGRIIAREGLRELTHRRVACEADVPVGSTTFYFNHLEALQDAALTHAATTATAHLDQWRPELKKNSELPTAFAQLTVDYLADRNRHRILN